MLLKARTQSPCFLYPGLARSFKNPWYTPGRLKHELYVVLDEKARAFGKTSKLTNKKVRASAMFSAPKAGASPCFLVKM
jgi:hypothetical protein